MNPRATDANRTWFARVTIAHLELPTGPFGRPGADLYRFSDVRLEGDTLTLVLEEQHLFLTLEDPAVQAGDHELTLSSSAAIVFQQKEFARQRWHEEVLPPGTVRLWEHPSVTEDVAAPKRT